jgi:hypothetical protein
MDSRVCLPCMCNREWIPGCACPVCAIGNRFQGVPVLYVHAVDHDADKVVPSYFGRVCHCVGSVFIVAYTHSCTGRAPDLDVEHVPAGMGDLGFWCESE